MTAQQFHEGQDVEVFKIITPPAYGRWRKAKIVSYVNVDHQTRDHYEVEFPDGSRAVFDAENIRAVEPRSPRALRPTATEQNPSYRTAMRGAGRGKLLP
jgi:hypothetical protein